MKIAIVSDAIYPYNKGGKEKRIFELATRYVAAGHEVHIYTMHWWKGPRIVQENGITLHGVCRLQGLYTPEGRRSLREAIIFAWNVFFPLLRGRFDLIEVDHIPYLPIFSGRIVAWLRGKPLIATWHEVWGRTAWKQYLGGWKAWLATLIEWSSVKLPDRIISVSALTTHRLTEEFRVPSKKILTVPNGIALDLIDRVASAKEKSDLIFAGRLLKHKNIDLAIRVLARIKEESGLKPTFFIIGDGPERHALEKLTTQLGLESQVRFFGFVEDECDVYALMKASKLCFSPSAREGFGILAVEAQACGLPVLTVDVPENAMKDLIQSGENGWVVPLDEKEIAAVVKKFLTTSSELTLDRARARRQSRESDWRQLSEQLINRYEGIVQRAKHRSWTLLKWENIDISIALMIFAAAMILGLGLVQDGSFFSSDGHRYSEYAEHFIRGDFDLSNTSHPFFPSTYSLLASPVVYFFHQLDFGVAFAFRLVNIFCFAFTTVLIFVLGRMMGLRRRWSGFSAMIYAFATPSIAIAIDLWPQNISIFAGTLLTTLSLLFWQTKQLRFFWFSAFALAMILYVRVFEVVFYLPQLLILGLSLMRETGGVASSPLKRMLKLVGPMLLWGAIFGLSILPLLLFNLKNYQTLAGYYSTSVSREAHQFYFAISNLLPHWKELIFHFSIDRPDLPAHRPTLAILESAPLIVLSVFGLARLIKRNKLATLALGFTIFAGLTFYAAFNFWTDPFTPSMRFLLVIFPSLCLLTAVAVEWIFQQAGRRGAVWLGFLSILVLGVGMGFFAQDFFQRLILTNIGVWGIRTEIKTLGHFLYGSMFWLAIGLLALSGLVRRPRFAVVKAWLGGSLAGLMFFSFLHSVYANVVSAAFSIRYGEQVYRYFDFSFLRYTATEFRSTNGSQFEFLFWFFVFIFVFQVSSIFFRSLKPLIYEKKDIDRHAVLSSRGRRA